MCMITVKSCRNLVVCTQLNTTLICLASLLVLKPSYQSSFLLKKLNKNMEDQNICFDTFDLEQIDDYSLAEQLVSTNNDHAAGESSEHDSEFTAMNYESLGNSNCSETASASESLLVKMQLQCRIKEKMRAEGKEDTVVNILANTVDNNQLTPEDIQKRQDKQRRNKEAAHKSRQKKKESEKLLKEDHEMLETINQELKHDVLQLKNNIKIYENFLGSHICMIMIQYNVPQQDHGDDHYKETGRKQVYAVDEGACRNPLWNSEDDKFVEAFLNDFDLNLSFRPQRREHILQCLQEGQSQIVTSGTSYETNNYLCNTGYNISIQETMLPDNFCERKEVTPKVSSEVMGDKMLENSSAVLGHNGGRITSESKVNPLGGVTSRYAWATDTDSQIEEREALEEVKALHPPPEKRPRLE